MMDFTAGVPQKSEGKKKRTFAKLHRPNTPWIVGGAVIGVLLVASISTALYFFGKYQNARQIVNKTVVEASTKEAVSKEVSKIYAVPSEEPTLARVNDPAELRKQQEFFDKASEGDYVLVYPKAELAILYRQAEKKIINVGPVSVGTDKNSGQNAVQAPNQ